MNGSPSVRVALNPRADGSMSPEYTKGALNFWKACTIALEYSSGCFLSNANMKCILPNSEIEISYGDQLSFRKRKIASTCSKSSDVR